MAVRCLLFVVVVLSALSSACVNHTSILVPDVQVPPAATTAKRPGLFLDIRRLPHPSSVSFVAPAGNRATLNNRPRPVGAQLRRHLRDLADAKGYTVVDAPAVADFVLRVEFEAFRFEWQQEMLASSEGRANLSVRHVLFALRPQTQLWTWEHERHTSYGWYPGNCWGGFACATVVGYIPYLIWALAVQDVPAEQTSKFATQQLTAYANELGKSLPDAAHAVELGAASGNRVGSDDVDDIDSGAPAASDDDTGFDDGM